MDSQHDLIGLTMEEDAQQRAREWIALLQSSEVSEADHQRFKRWLALDARHRYAYQEAESIWQAVGGLTELGALEPRVDAHIRVNHGQKQRSGAAAGLLARIKRQLLLPSAPRSNAAWTGWGMALASVLMVALFVRPQPPAQPESIFYQTETAETRHLSLADGSTISLSPESRIEVLYSDAQRRVKLLAGEAFFDVAKNPQRPFIVDSRFTQVTVLGTMFNVNNRHHDVTVAVEEGRVQVVGQGIEGRGNREIKLAAGQLVSVSRAEGLSPVEGIDPKVAGAWREDVRVYQARPLVQVLEDLDRYHPADLFIVDERLKQLPVTAIFPTKDAEQLLTALESILPISVETIEQGRIEIRAR